MTRFANRVAVVTGAASGLGRATASMLANEGARVAVLDLAGDAAEKSAAEIGERGGSARAYALDVRDPDQARDTVARVADDIGPPDVLVNAAGIGGFAHSDQESFEQWSRIIAVNLTGTFLMCQAVLPAMLERGGAIVNIASNAGLKAQKYSAAYCASKGGVVNLTRALAYEYLGRGVRVNAVAPGGMNTPMIQAFTFPEGASMRDFANITSPLGYAEPEDVANAVLFVASDDARFMTGSIVSVDGGIMAG
jgi:NAD(P)-dependent dehydrogenase (short-subunit alcohol dehydrogenase family)